MKKDKWIRGKMCDMFIGKKHVYAFGINEKKNFLIISSNPDWESGTFRRVKDFTTAKKIVTCLEK